MSFVLFDTHAHLQLRDFDRDRENVFQRAREAGLRGFLVVGFDEKSSLEAVRLAEERSDCWATVGLHPHDARNWNDVFHSRLEELACHPKVVAVGETGLDFYRDLSPREAQEKAFLGQIQIASRLSKPLVIHNRNATPEVLETLARHAEGIPIVLHAFNGDEHDADRALALGCLLGIGGPVTYPKAEPLREGIKHLPPERFFLETDAPWLSPQPRRGRRNEPAFLRFIAEEVARLRNESLESLARQTTQNACRFFGLPLPC